MAEIDPLVRLKKRKEKLDSWHKRQDEDMGKYLLESFVWRDKAGKEIPDVENVTMNDPGTFADRVVTILGTGKRYLDIECGTQVEADATRAEAFINFCLDRNEEHLLEQQVFPLEESQDWQTTHRGAACGRVLLLREGNKYKVDIKPIDPRSVVWIPGKNGSVLTGIFGKMTKDAIFEEYGLTVTDEEPEVWEIWSPTQQFIYIADKLERTVTHNLGMNPVFMVLCPTSPVIAGRDDAVKHQGESVFAKVRHLYDVLNKAATQWFTQNAMGILPGMQVITKDGRKMKTSPFGIMALTYLRVGEQIKAMPITDVSVSHQAFFGQIMVRIQRATMTNIDYGELSFELSALAIKELEAKNDPILIPRLKAKRMLMRMIGDALIKQFVSGGYKTNLGGFGYEIPFKPGDFKGKRFTIHVDYVATSTQESIADATIAANWKALGMPEEWIWENVLHIEDVDSLRDMRDRERVGDECMAVRFYRYGRKLWESGKPEDKMEAQLVLEEIGLSLDVLGGNQEKGAGARKQPPSQPKLTLGVKQTPLVGGGKAIPEEKIAAEQQRREGIMPAKRGKE